MGQILTLMVFGDAINNGDDIEDGGMNGALISGPPGPEICDPEVSCDRATASTADGAPHGKDSSADAAGQRVGEHSRRGSLALDTCCLLYTSPSPRDGLLSRMPSSA